MECDNKSADMITIATKEEGLLWRPRETAFGTLMNERICLIPSFLLFCEERARLADRKHLLACLSRSKMCFSFAHKKIREDKCRGRGARPQNYVAHPQTDRRTSDRRTHGGFGFKNKVTVFVSVSGMNLAVLARKMNKNDDGARLVAAPSFILLASVRAHT